MVEFNEESVRREVRAWLEKALAAFPVTQHFISNTVVDLDGDRAESRPAGVAPQRSVDANGQQVTQGCIHYD